MRPRSTRPAGQRIVAWAGGPGSWRSARPGSTTTASSARSPTSSRTCAGTSPSRPTTGKPVILHCRSAAGRRDAQDALLGRAARRWAAPTVRRRHPLVLRAGRLRRGDARPRAGAELLRARLPARRGGVGRAPPASRRSIASSSRPIRRSWRHPARHAGATSRSGCASQRRGSRSARHRRPTPSATHLIADLRPADFGATSGRQRPTVDPPRRRRGMPVAALLATVACVRGRAAERQSRPAPPRRRPTRARAAADRESRRRPSGPSAAPPSVDASASPDPSATERFSGGLRGRDRRPVALPSTGSTDVRVVRARTARTVVDLRVRQSLVAGPATGPVGWLARGRRAALHRRRQRRYAIDMTASTSRSSGSRGMSLSTTSAQPTYDGPSRVQAGCEALRTVVNSERSRASSAGTSGTTGRAA